MKHPFLPHIVAGLAAIGSLAAAPPTANPSDPADTRVTLPYAELRRLLDVANAAEAERKRIVEPPPPPLASALLAARYRLTPNPDAPRLEAEFDTIQLAKGWQSIPLTRTRAAVRSVEPKDALVLELEGALCLLSQEPGRRTIRVEFELPPGPESGPLAVIGTAAATSNTLDLLALPDGVPLRATGVVGPLRPGRLPLPAHAAEFAVERIRERPEIPMEWSILTQSFAEETEGGISVQTRISASALTAGDGPLIVTLPADAVDIRTRGEVQVRTTDARPPRLELRWPSKPAPATVEYRLPASPLATAWNVALPAFGSARNHEAVLVAACPASARLDAAGTRRNPAGLPSWIADAVQGREFVLSRSTEPLTLAIQRQVLAETAEAVIRAARFQTRMTVAGSLHGEAEFDVECAASQRLPLRLPEGAELLTCDVQGQRVRPALAEGGTLEIAVPAGKDKPVVVRVSYTARGERPDPAQGHLTLALPTTPTFIHRTEWTVSLPAAWEVRGVEGPFEQIETPPVTADGTRVVLRSQFTRNDSPTTEIHYRARVREQR
jgi:hypothetical protein